MSAFWIHFQLGFSHLTDLNGYDHMLFLAALCALYTLKDWRKVAILATAFTVGHSLTLALSAWGAVDIDPGLIEVLIPA
ncbi:MAG: HupE/UreJ family protein, partial [Bacteroidota bacterium]